MIECLVGDITSVSVDAIVNASNAIGVMGAGVAGAIRNAAGMEVQKEARKVCRMYKIAEGECFSTSSGDLSGRGVDKIYHAVTMTSPGQIASLHSVENSFRKCLLMAVRDKVKKIAVPGLGTGIGKLDKATAARAMFKVARAFMEKLDILFVDLDDMFISELAELKERNLG